MSAEQPKCHVIFDLDGTIIDSGEVVAAHLAQTLDEVGFAHAGPIDIGSGWVRRSVSRSVRRGWIPIKCSGLSAYTRS